MKKTKSAITTLLCLAIVSLFSCSYEKQGIDESQNQDILKEKNLSKTNCRPELTDKQQAKINQIIAEISERGKSKSIHIDNEWVQDFEKRYETTILQ